MEFPNIYRKIEIIHNFDKEKVIRSKEFKEFCEKYPKLEEGLKNVLSDIHRWLESTDECFDYYWASSVPFEEYIGRGDWDVDADNEECLTWEQARQQMGTTKDKYSLTQFFTNTRTDTLINADIRIIADFLSKVGFRIIHAYYESWRKGYDFAFYNTFDNDCGYDEYYHICIVVDQ